MNVESSKYGDGVMYMGTMWRFEAGCISEGVKEGLRMARGVG